MTERIKARDRLLPGFEWSLVGIFVLGALIFSSGVYGMGANKGAAPPGKSVKKGGATPPAAAKPAVPETIQVVVPVGTPIRSRINLTVKTSAAKAGSIFHATLIEPLVVSGQVIAPLGVPLEGFISKSIPPGRFQGGGLLELRLQRLILPDQQTYFLSTDPFVKEGKTTLTRNIGLIAAGGIVGAGLGSMLGQTVGALIGIGVGGGTGSVLSWAAGGTELTLPTGSEMIFKLSSPLTVTIRPTPSSTAGPK
jgi:hypothetical protein